MSAQTSQRRRTDPLIAVTWVWMFAVTVAVAVTLVLVIRNQAGADHRSQQSCERSLQFAPALANAYARYKILTGKELAGYRDTIPKSC